MCVWEGWGVRVTVRGGGWWGFDVRVCVCEGSPLERNEEPKIIP